MRKLTRWAAVAAVTALSMPFLALLTNAEAAVIFSDDFETEAFGLNTTLDHWTISDGTIDVVGPSFFGIACNGSTRCVDLDGSTGNAGRIETELLSLSLVGIHTLSFDLSGNQRGGSDTLQVFLGSTLLDTIALASNASFSTYTYNFTVASPSSERVIFDHAGGDNVGLILDNVVLRGPDDPTGVPEPMTLSLLGAGLIGLGAMRRRKA